MDVIRNSELKEPELKEIQVKLLLDFDVDITIAANPTKGGAGWKALRSITLSAVIRTLESTRFQDWFPVFTVTVSLHSTSDLLKECVAVHLQDR